MPPKGRTKQPARQQQSQESINGAQVGRLGLNKTSESARDQPRESINGSRFSGLSLNGAEQPTRRQNPEPKDGTHFASLSLSGPNEPARRQPQRSRKQPHQAIGFAPYGYSGAGEGNQPHYTNRVSVEYDPVFGHYRPVSPLSPVLQETIGWGPYWSAAFYEYITGYFLGPFLFFSTLPIAKSCYFLFACCKWVWRFLRRLHWRDPELLYRSAIGQLNPRPYRRPSSRGAEGEYITAQRYPVDSDYYVADSSSRAAHARLRLHPSQNQHSSRDLRRKCRSLSAHYR